MADITEQLAGVIPLVVVGGVVKTFTESMLGSPNKPITHKIGIKRRR